MGKIGVIHVDSGWILQHIGERVCAALPDVFQSIPVSQLINLTHKEAESFSGWYYVDIQNCWFPSMRTAFPDVPHIGMFTHLHEDSWDNFRAHWADLDGVVHMNSYYHDMFLQNKTYHPEQMIVSKPGGDFEVDLGEPIPYTFGIAQRGSDPDGNPIIGKGNGFLQEVITGLVKEETWNMALLFKGEGWNPDDFMVPKAEIHEGEDYRSYRDFYDKIDCLLVPSLWEGGPMAPLEALYLGKPVISARVGWMDDYRHGVELFPAGDVDACCELMESKIRHKARMRDQVNAMSYLHHAAGIAEMFSKNLTNG